MRARQRQARACDVRGSGQVAQVRTELRGSNPDGVSRFGPCDSGGVPRASGSRRPRSDAAMNRAHIVEAASALLRRSPRATMADVAADAHVSRGTLYRHFPTRADLLAAVSARARDAAVETAEDRLRP